MIKTIAPVVLFALFLTTVFAIPTLPITLRQQTPAPSPAVASPAASPASPAASPASPAPSPAASPASPAASPVASPAASPTGSLATTSPGASPPASAASGGESTEESPEASSDEEASPSPSEEPVCFPHDATVELEGGKNVQMKDVMIGDRVKVGVNEYSDVFMFTHRLEDVDSEFVKIDTKDGKSLRLTAGHYLYVNNKLMAAGHAKVGDKVQVEAGCTEIVKVEIVMGKGLYNPQTVHGDVVVDGVRASTYTTAVEPKFAHQLLAPMRALYKIAGISTSIFDSGNYGLARLAPKGQAVY